LSRGKRTSKESEVMKEGDAVASIARVESQKGKGLK